jgi:hypothetical protein
MSLRLPSRDSATRTGFLDTLRTSRDFLARTPDATKLHAFAFRADGDLWLIEITRQTWRKVWNFGQ